MGGNGGKWGGNGGEMGGNWENMGKNFSGLHHSHVVYDCLYLIWLGVVQLTAGYMCCDRAIPKSAFAVCVIVTLHNF